MKRNLQEISLTDHDRDMLYKKFVKISGSPYNNYRKFEKTAVNVARKYFPSYLYNAIMDLKTEIHGKGILLIKNLPVDEPLIPTPAGSDFDFNQKKTFVSEACSVAVGSILGQTYGYKNEKKGATLHNNFPTVSGKISLSNEGSLLKLAWHSEDVHTFPYNPDFVILNCLRGCREAKAETYLLNSADIIKQLSPEIIEQLRKSEYYTTPPQSFSVDADGSGRTMPVLSGHEDMPTMHVSFNNTKGITHKAEKALQVFEEACNNSLNVITVRLAAGNLLAFDNRVNIHARNNFPAHFDGLDRWLQRLFVKDGSMRTWREKLLNSVSKTVNL